MAHLDKAVIDDFDIIAFYAGVPRKRNKPPTVTSRGNVSGDYIDGKPILTFNLGPGVIHDKTGRKVVPFSGKDRHIRPKIEDVGNGVARVDFEFQFGGSKKFRRGMYKIALASLAFYLGIEEALKEQLNPVREYVTEGKDDRIIMFKPSPEKTFRNQAWRPFKNPEGHYSIPIRIANVEMLTDLSPDQSLAAEFRAKAYELYGQEGWAFSPIS